MKEQIIKENEAGQRLDKYLAKLLREAPKSFFYKMLRKKNITLNGKKALGSEQLCQGDVVRLFLSDETFEKFKGQEEVALAHKKLQILYEDRHVILVNKPAGMLSQPAGKKDGPSLVEYLTGYLLESGAVTKEELRTFRPSVCNRLDRNTSGIVAAGKTLAGLQMLSEMFHDRSLHKYYLCLVKGRVKKERYIKGYLQKEETCNKVEIYQEEREGSLPIETAYAPLEGNEEMTLLSVLLLTGRTHQIRAHLASIGHPILGDSKYGDSDFNRRYGEKSRLKHQLLHAYRLEFPRLTGDFAPLSQKRVTAPVPPQFLKALKEQHLEESYYENLE
jgi:RluA family pseudouridine synthase